MSFQVDHQLLLISVVMVMEEPTYFRATMKYIGSGITAKTLITKVADGQQGTPVCQ